MHLGLVRHCNHQVRWLQDNVKSTLAEPTSRLSTEMQIRNVNRNDMLGSREASYHSVITFPNFATHSVPSFNKISRFTIIYVSKLGTELADVLDLSYCDIVNTSIAHPNC
uniref:Uncharacterized protein n=1 Tax=Arundo donax TaxID=35708 RepID=A0A0A9CT93_ARUDO